MISRSNHLAAEKSKSCLIVIGLKTKIGNLGYTTMQKKMQHYYTEKDAAFCSTCINATRMKLITSKNADKGFISNVFTNYQDAGTENRDLDKHFPSEAHREGH